MIDFSFLCVDSATAEDASFHTEEEITLHELNILKPAEMIGGEIEKTSFYNDYGCKVFLTKCIQSLCIFDHFGCMFGPSSSLNFDPGASPPSCGKSKRSEITVAQWPF